MQTRFPGVDLPGELLEAALDRAFPLVRRLRAEELRHELFQILQRGRIVVLEICLRKPFTNLSTFMRYPDKMRDGRAVVLSRIQRERSSESLYHGSLCG